MKTKPRDDKPAIIPAAQQPAQLELFRLVTTDAYSNAVEFYEAIPRYLVGR